MTSLEAIKVSSEQHGPYTGTATRREAYGVLTASPTPARQKYVGSSSSIQNEITAEFAELAARWHRETGMYSLEIQKTSHSAYLRIIGMGSRAIPLILEDLQEHGGLWYQALESILGYSPVRGR